MKFCFYRPYNTTIYNVIIFYYIKLYIFNSITLYFAIHIPLIYFNNIINKTEKKSFNRILLFVLMNAYFQLYVLYIILLVNYSYIHFA